MEDDWLQQSHLVDVLNVRQLFAFFFNLVLVLILMKVLCVVLVQLLVQIMVLFCSQSWV